MPDWLSSVGVPEWLSEVVRPKKAPVPWGTMLRAVLALWVPMAVAFGTGRRDLALLPAMGGLLSISIDNGGPYVDRVKRIGTAGVLGGAPGLFIGTLIHGRGWIAVVALVVVAGASSILARLGGVGSVTGLQLYVYSTLGLGALGTLRPWWHTALQFLAGVAWALLLITPGYLLSPRSAERKAVADVYHALARDLRLIGTPGMAAAGTTLSGALNAAYDAVLTGRATSSGRSARDTHLLAVLNASHQFAEADAALRISGEPVPPLIPDIVDLLGDAVLDERGPGSGAVGLGSRRAGGAGRSGRARRFGRFGPGGRFGRGGRAGRDGPAGPGLPIIPPPWSASPGALALRDALVALTRVMSGNWTPPDTPGQGLPDVDPPAGLAERLRSRFDWLVEQLIGGRIAWEFTIRLMICTGAGAVISQVLPLSRSYWLLLTVGIILKPDYGSVFVRAVQRGIGTIVGAVLGAAILAIVPYGPWLLVPFGVLAALLPYAKARSFGLVAVFLTPLVVLLIDLLDVGGWQLAEARLVDTVLGCAVVLLVGYAPWPSAWQAHLPGQFADTLRAVSAYADQALVETPAARIAETGTALAIGQAAGSGPSWRSLLRRRAYRAQSNLRAEFQRMMSEPPAVSRRASAWWPAVVALEEVIDAVTAYVVAIGRGAPVPQAASVHQLTGLLRSIADAIEAGTPPPAVGPLPGDPELEGVTSSIRSVLAVLVRSGGDAAEPAAGVRLCSR